MSFAQKLAVATDKADAEKKERARQEALRQDAAEAQKIRSWADAEIENLKKKCQEAVATCTYSCAFITGSCCFEQRECNKGLRQRELEHRVKGLGFSSHKIEERIVIPDGVRQGVNSNKFSIAVSWKNVSRDPSEPPKKRLKGHARTCQVCEEKKSMVVLAPCGHVLCQDCREKQTKQKNYQCPFCRQHVICVTEGLFFS